MEGLDSTMIAVSIPDMAQRPRRSPLRLNLVITTYLLSLAVFIPVSGWIADRLGTRRVFCVAIAIFAAGSALCGLSTSLPMLLVMRVLQGFGGAMMTPVGRLILLRSFPRVGSRLGDELDDDPGDDRADRRPDRRRLADDLCLVALDLLSQHADRRRRRRCWRCG